jgi:hypothetical protein
LRRFIPSTYFPDSLGVSAQACTYGCSAYSDTFVNLPLFFLLYSGESLLGNADTFSSLYFSPSF